MFLGNLSNRIRKIFQSDFIPVRNNFCESDSQFWLGQKTASSRNSHNPYSWSSALKKIDNLRKRGRLFVDWAKVCTYTKVATKEIYEFRSSGIVATATVARWMTSYGDRFFKSLVENLSSKLIFITWLLENAKRRIIFWFWKTKNRICVEVSMQCT